MGIETVVVVGLRGPKSGPQERTKDEQCRNSAGWNEEGTHGDPWNEMVEAFELPTSDAHPWAVGHRRPHSARKGPDATTRLRTHSCDGGWTTGTRCRHTTLGCWKDSGTAISA